MLKGNNVSWYKLWYMRFCKFLHDFTLIFYDDLEFKALSLPRTTIGLLTFIYIYSWVSAQFFGYTHNMDNFPMVYATAWGAYSIKAWKRCEHDGHQQNYTYTYSGSSTQDGRQPDGPEQ